MSRCEQISRCNISCLLIWYKTREKPFKHSLIEVIHANSTFTFYFLGFIDQIKHGSILAFYFSNTARPQLDSNPVHWHLNNLPLKGLQYFYLKPLHSGRGGFRIFSRRDQKISKNSINLFFRSTKLIFRALTNHYKDPILTKFSAQQAELWKKKPAIKGVSVTFWKI